MSWFNLLIALAIAFLAWLGENPLLGCWAILLLVFTWLGRAPS